MIEIFIAIALLVVGVIETAIGVSVFTESRRQGWKPGVFVGVVAGLGGMLALVAFGAIIGASAA